MASKEKLKLLIVNQHGENHGDEAAFRAMVSSFKDLYDVKVSVIGQFKKKDFRFEVDRDVQFYNMVMPFLDAISLLVYFAFACIGISSKNFQTSFAKKIVTLYKEADLVVSGPGGPYFGDIYKMHEFVHWFFISMAKAEKKPCYLYAPSVGPFRFRPFNFFRKRLFRAFSLVILRESQSAKYLSDLDNGIASIVTADSALQDKSYRNFDHKEIAFGGVFEGAKKLVCISVINHKFVDDAARVAYESGIVNFISWLSRKEDVRFILLPQLYGGVHSDSLYLNQLRDALEKTVDAVVLDENFSSDVHRYIISKSMLVVSSRYHPQIFSVSSRTPLIAICYQHKSKAFMESAGLGEYSIDINAVDFVKLKELYISIKDSLPVYAKVEDLVQDLEMKASQTTNLIYQDYEEQAKC